MTRQFNITSRNENQVRVSLPDGHLVSHLLDSFKHQTTMTPKKTTTTYDRWYIETARKCDKMNDDELALCYRLALARLEKAKAKANASAAVWALRKSSK